MVKRMLRVARELEESVSRCSRCAFVDKPYVKHRAYLNWLPSKVRVLAVGESPPPSRKESFFYNLSAFDRLRLSMKLITSFSGGDEGLLKSLREHGVFVTAAVKCRPLSRREIPWMRGRCVFILKRELELLKPEKVVAMGSTATLSLLSALGLKHRPSIRNLEELSYNGLKAVFTPHPNYIFRFRRDLAGEVMARLLY